MLVCCFLQMRFPRMEFVCSVRVSCCEILSDVFCTCERTHTHTHTHTDTFTLSLFRTYLHVLGLVRTYTHAPTHSIRTTSSSTRNRAKASLFISVWCKKLSARVSEPSFAVCVCVCWCVCACVCECVCVCMCVCVCVCVCVSVRCMCAVMLTCSPLRVSGVQFPIRARWLPPLPTPKRRSIWIRRLKRSTPFGFLIAARRCGVVLLCTCYCPDCFRAQHIRSIQCFFLFLCVLV